jgi:drug/metabolite transporter (DMT)-like permease
MKKRITSYDLALMDSLVVIWGSSFAMSKIAIRDLDATWIAALRLCIGAAVMMAIAIWNNESPWYKRESWPKYAWLGFIGNALPFVLITWGIQYTSSGVSGLLMGTIPLFVILIAHGLLPDERLTTWKTIGFLIGFAGIIVLIDPRNLSGLSFTGGELTGELAIVAGCLCYGFHSVTAKRLGFDKPFQQTAGILLSGAVLALIFAVAKKPAGLADMTSAALLATLGLGLFPTALATVIMYKAMERNGPSFVSFTNYLVPVFALLLGAVLFGEKLYWNIAFALALILSGIAVTRLSRS